MIIQVLLNVGYGLMLIALAVRDILWLRTVFMAAQLCLFVYAIVAQNLNVALWNFLFFTINTFHWVRLMRERRPIDLSPDIADLYKKVFSSMTRREFLYFWHMGHQREIADKLLIRHGVVQTELSLILDGSVLVEKENRTIAILSRGSFVAEMSFLTGEPASADVRAAKPVKYITWKQEKIRGLEQLNAGLYIKIQNILGKDLAEKVKMAS